MFPVLLPKLASLPMLFIGAAIFMLGVIVVARERLSAVSISFLLLTTTVWCWLTSISLMAMTVTAGAAMPFARFAYVGIALIPASVLQFTAALLGATRRWSTALTVTWIASAIFATLFTASNALLAGTWHYSWGFYPRLAAPSSVFLIYFALVLGASLLLLARTRPLTEQERRRNTAFAGALSVGYVGSIDYLPAFGIDVYPIGFLAVLGFMALSTRAIMRFRLADLTPSFVANQLLATMHGGVIVVDTHGRVRVANQVAAELLGWPLAEMQDADLRTLLGTPILPVTDSESFCRRNQTRNHLAKWRRRDLSEVELSVSASTLRDESAEAVGLLYAISDLSDRRRAERNEYGATHDLLTRLPNRTRFAQAFNEAKDRIVATNRVPAILFIDLDGFKSVNDRHGHAVGDALLQLVASRIRNAIRGEDVLARYGGDEFVVFVDLARIEDAELVGGKLLRVVSAPYAIDEHRVTITASIGAAFFPRDGVTVDALVATADAAMYTAKRSGKARLHVIRDDKPSPPPFGIDARA